MEANQLRIGNWVIYDGRPFKIYGISKEYPFLDTIEFGHGVVEWKDLQPIELTEEILLKCGFEEKGLLYRLECEDFVFRSDGEYVWVYRKDTKGCIVVNCNHLHQLQNIIFALTNQELKIEL